MKSKKQIRTPRNKSKKFREGNIKGGGELENQLFEACHRGDMKEAMALLDRGADVHARDIHQRTPLHCACG